MIFVWGHRMYGKIEKSGPTYVATRFFHLWYLPLIPLGSQLVLAETEDGKLRCIGQGLSWRSTLAGYLRIWGPVATIAAGVGLAGASFDDVSEVAEHGLLFALAAGAAIWAWVALGRLSVDELAQRQAYMRWSGLPVDVGLLRERRDGLARTVGERITELAGQKGMLGYRGAMPADAELLQLVADSPSADAEALGAAMTLCRIERSRANDGASRARFDALHARLWGRLKQAEGAPVAQAA